MPTIYHFGLSGGKDSTALWGWAINESGYPRELIRGSFADTENEYPEVYQQIEALSRYGVERGIAPVRTLHSIGFLGLAIKKQRFPGAKARFCTEQLKIWPAIEYFEELMPDGYEVISHSGVRRDESIERSMMDEWTSDPKTGVRVRRPILDWTIADVWEAHRKYGVPINPLYLQGWKRVGCRLCCMSNKADVRRTAKLRPWVIDEYRKWEIEVGKVRANGFSSFFPAATIPDSQCSRTYTNKDGTVYAIGDIDDAVRWSKTLRGGVQPGFEFMFDDDDAAAPCAAGYCE